MQLNIIDISIIVIYLIGTVFLGIYLSKRASKDINNYFLGGNKIPWYFLGISGVSGMFDIAGTMLLVYWLSVYGLKSVWLPWLWGSQIGHLWRTTGDIYNCFDCIKDHRTWKSWGVTYILDMQDSLRKYAGPGHWNDPDMLEVGNGMFVNEDRAHFSMWCMLAAPLIAGNDIRNMSNETREILTNKEVLAVDQDSLGIQCFKYNNNNNVESWFNPLANSDWAMCVLNQSNTPQNFTFNWKNEKVFDKDFVKETSFAKITYKLRNLWSKEDSGTTKYTFTANIPAHDVVMLRLIKLLYETGVNIIQKKYLWI